jgi:hypothetical protein
MMMDQEAQLHAYVPVAGERGAMQERDAKPKSLSNNSNRGTRRNTPNLLKGRRLDRWKQLEARMRHMEVFVNRIDIRTIIRGIVPKWSTA